MQQVAEENGLDVVKQLENNPIGTKLPTAEETRSTEQEDKLSKRQVQTAAALASVIIIV